MKKAIHIILIFALALMAVSIGAAALRIWDTNRNLSLEMNGERHIYVEYGQDYTEPGVRAFNQETGEEIPVTVTGQVDIKRVGKYLLKYTAQVEDMIRTDYRYVYVQDTQAPVIQLTESPDSYTLINHPYQEEGFSATDNYDGDLTRQVNRKEADGIVSYTVTDSSGNT